MLGRYEVLISTNNTVKKGCNHWYSNIDKDKYYTVLTDDIDSYLSCLFLKKKFGLEVGGFYDFESLYVNSELTKGKEPIYVDCDVVKGLAFGNHVTGIKNKDCYNLNNTITEENYTDKFAGSTFMTLLSLYDVDLSKVPVDYLIFFLTVDVWFKQYYCFRDKWDYWTKVMGFEDLTEVITTYGMTLNDYYMLIHDYSINNSIHILGYEGNYDLFFNLDYEGIKKDFGLDIPKPTYKFDKVIADFRIGRGDSQSLNKKKDSLFSDAMTYCGRYCYSFVF